MTPTRSGSNHTIQSNASGPGHSIHKSKRKECHPREQAQMEDDRTSTNSQRLAITFDTLLERNSGNIPVSLQELIYGGKTAGVGTSSKPLDRDHVLLSSSKEAHEPRKDRGPSEGLDTHVLQRKSPKYKSLVEKPKHVVKGPEERVGPNKGKQTSGSSSSPHKQESASTSAKKGQASPKEQSEGKEKCKVKM
ncbi:hypothetical protein O181_054723 [Austropuccinia psidii MF-1]|uniref:Uncharacterized protein n=1 Tax=Austropuccinia psidii MF-1 TaxID=1389203 RepID=A0A9Q3E9U6_9BASI|nr:hypothetical protein [Austropuccinia psidii MF-1]